MCLAVTAEPVVFGVGSVAFLVPPPASDTTTTCAPWLCTMPGTAVLPHICVAYSAISLHLRVWLQTSAVAMAKFAVNTGEQSGNGRCVQQERLLRAAAVLPCALLRPANHIAVCLCVLCMPMIYDRDFLCDRTRVCIHDQEKIVGIFQEGIVWHSSDDYAE